MIKSIVLLLAILVSPFAFASMQDLINQHATRPTMSQVAEELKNDKSISARPDLIFQSFDNVAKFIAEIEWAYPGAIYMPLGRDVAVLGDMLDAFYLSQGQKGRVMRLNASGPSLQVSDQFIVSFVKSSGVDIKNLLSGPSYVVFDVTGYNLPKGSQCTRILHAIYNEYVNQGGNAKDILKKFAFFNTYPNQDSLKVNPGVDREAYFQEQSAYLERHPMSIPQRPFSSSVYVKSTADFFNYVGEWHLSFGVLQGRPDGSVTALPKGFHSEEIRTQTLSAMIAMFDVVRSEAFLKKIQSRAKELGYEFKFKNCDSVLGDNL